MPKLPLTVAGAMLAALLSAETKVCKMSGERVECPLAATYFAPRYDLKGNLAATRTLVHSGKDAVAKFELTAKSVTPAAEFAVIATFAHGDYCGGRVVTDGKSVEIPSLLHKRVQIVSGKFSTFALYDCEGKRRLNLAFDAPQRLVFADDGFWNEDALRLTLSAGDWKEKIEPSVKKSIVIRFVDSDGVEVVEDSTVEIKQGKDWIPIVVEPAIADGSPLDFSSMCPNRHPAGSLGWVLAKGDHFELERRPGVPQRFYGVNFCGDACIPEASVAERTAANLRKIGYNAIRIHHHENSLKDRNSKGMTALDPKAMERFDYFMYCLITNGIYITTDLYVSRHGVKFRDCGIDRDGVLDMQEYKDLVMTNEGVYSNYLAWTKNFLGHINPHTGRSYANEPALSLISLVNEGHPGDMSSARKTGDLNRLWQIWRANHKDAPQELPGHFWGNSTNAAACAAFIRDVEADFFRRTRKFLREEMGCRALLTNLNDGLFYIGGQLTRAEDYDYVDEHFYVDHPRFVERNWNLPSRCPNANPLKNPAMGALEDVPVRIANRPFTITEYNYSAPGRFRGVGGILCGTMASLQDWSGLWRFAWTHTKANLEHPTGSRMGYFDVSCDPLACAAERASICLFLRRDLEPMKDRLALTVPRDELYRPIVLQDMRSRDFDSRWAGWFARIGFVVGSEKPAWAKWQLEGLKGYHATSAEVSELLFRGNSKAVAGGGAIDIDSNRGAFAINTERTSGGFCESGELDSGCLRTDITDAPATVWVSALDGKAIRESGHLLLTHLTDVQNSNIRYGDAGLRLTLGWGKLPHLMRRGTAKISIQTSPSTSYKVYALGSDGKRRFRVEAEFSQGKLSFLADNAKDSKSATYLYEIIKE